MSQNILGLVVLYFVLVGVMIVGYVTNVVGLCKCDFEPHYKAEIVRTIGVFVPPVGAIVGFIGVDDVKEDLTD